MVPAPCPCVTKGTRFCKLPDGTWQPQEVSGSPLLSLEWGPTHDAASHAPKKALPNPPMLAFPAFTVPFIVYIRASYDSMAVCLH